MPFRDFFPRSLAIQSPHAVNHRIISMTDEKKPAMEKLEIEDEEARFQRIQSTLEKLNASPPSASASASTTRPILPLPSARPKPHFVPPSDLLSRVQAFLPQLEASNAELSQRARADPASVDIESVPEGAERYIEMSLGLGVFEQKGAGGEDADMSGSSDSDSDSDSEEGEGGGAPGTGGTGPTTSS